MTARHFVKSIAVLLLAASVSACTTAEGPREGLAASDPFEPTNRVIHSFNVRADRNILSPLAEGYDLVTPALFQHMIGNGLQHLDLTNDFANYLLQADIDRALETFGRFAINTIVGMGGFLDPATEFGLPKDGTDFGITLGKYGVAEGPYLVLPLLGPSTLRDTGGFIVDRAFSPTTYLGYVADGSVAIDLVGPGITGVGILHQRNENRDLIDDVLYNSVDSYVTIRSGYLQRRRAKIAGEEAATDQLPDIFDEPTQ